MSAKHWLGMAVACAAAFGVATAAQAASKKRMVPVVRGCTHFVVPACVGITRGGKTYVLHGGQPWIPTGVGIDVYGKIEGVSMCGGTVVQVTSWKRNRLLCASKG